jgi:molybdopterin converting factor small subunit
MQATVKVHLPEKLTGIREDRLKVELPDGSLLEDVYRLLGARYPIFAKRFLSQPAKNAMVPLFAMINKKGSGLSRELREGDSVEIFLMAAGG